MAIQAVRLVDAKNLFDSVLDTVLLDPPVAVGVMMPDGVHARVVGRKNGEIKIDYPECIKPGDMIIVRDRKDW